VLGRPAYGFTLIEMVIVLVIVGLLLGSVLKGQELIVGGRVRHLIAQQEGIRAAFFGFQDRFRALPGDFSSAHRALRCAGAAGCLNGNGNGIVESGAASVLVAGVASEVHEELLVWMHLASAGFMSGSYTMSAGESAPSDTNSPKNAYNIFLRLAFDGQFADTAPVPPSRHNLKTGSQIPVEVVGELDRKIDDGNGLRGTFRYSTYQGNAPAAPPAPAAVHAPGQCLSTSGQWFVAQGEVNCGGTSLL